MKKALIATSKNSTEAESVAEEMLIDIRPLAVFAAGHVPNAAHFDGVNGVDGLLACDCELPERTARARLHVAVIATDATDIVPAVDALRRAGFASARELPVHKFAATAMGGGRRLWSPSTLAMRAEALASIHGGVRTALDVGCGGGRDSAWLAARGWRVVAADRSDVLAARVERLARKCYAGDDVDASRAGGVRAVVRTFGACRMADAMWLREHAAALVLVVRFLRRPVLPLLHEAVKPGGLLAYEHFLEGCEKFGSPRKPAQMLRRGELAALFCDDNGFDILLDEEGKLADGRPINRFIARRRLGDGTELGYNSLLE